MDTNQCKDFTTLQVHEGGKASENAGGLLLSLGGGGLGSQFCC